MVESQLGLKIRILRLDNKGEYKSHKFIHFYEENGIKQQFTIPCFCNKIKPLNPRNTSLVGTTIAMFSHFQLSNTFRGETLTKTNYLQNKSPTKFIASGKTRIRSWTGVKFDLSHWA
jgi:hypothetical protein